MVGPLGAHDAIAVVRHEVNGTVAAGAVDDEAGFSFEAEDIAPLFERAKEMKNISLPESFWEVIE